jgi:sulfur relay (sulfurtransferase) DsrC/TusE family protein
VIEKNMTTRDYRMEFAATIFIRECIRQYLKRHPRASLDEMPIKPLCEYAPADQQALIAAIAKATEASAGMNDLYRQFLTEKLEVARSKAT